jgi:hypothetical protein
MMDMLTSTQDLRPVGLTAGRFLSGEKPMDVYPPTIQRPALLELMKAIGCRDNALRRDECGDWRINGRRGHIYAVPGSSARFQMLIMGWAANGWRRAKMAFAPFAELTNDGDDEGTLLIDRLPTDQEAEIVRHFVGIAKKKELSEETLTRLRRQGFHTERQKNERRTGMEVSEVSR